MAAKPGMVKGAETYWVLRKDQLSCLASPVRMDIIDHLAGRPPTSIRDLAVRIGKRPSAIYHHLRQLVAVGLAVEAGAQVLNRKSERLYSTPAPRVRLKKALSDAENADLMRGIVGAMLRQSDRDFAAGIGSRAAKSEGPYRNLGMFRLINRPSRRSLRRINSLLDELAEILWREDEPGEPLVALTWVMTPVDGSEECDNS